MIAIDKIQNSQTKSKLTYEKFVNLRLTDGRYEFVNGEVVKVVNTRQHEDVVAFAYKKFDREIDRLNLDFVVRQNVSIRTVASSDKQSRVPDLSVIDKEFWRSNPSDYAPLQKPIQLAVEVTSTNWDDDYIDKFSEYQSLGIPEYWIVDYLAIASREFLGNPKVPTVFVNLLDENGKYQTTRFTGDDKITSRTFPELNLTAAQIQHLGCSVTSQLNNNGDKSMIVGEIITQEGDIELNAGREVITLKVANSGDRPIQVGSHYHFYETNRALIFDRDRAKGTHLDIPAGTSIRFEPGDEKEVNLVPYVGTREIYGFNALVEGKLEG